jgi:hypothetical protein
VIDLITDTLLSLTTAAKLVPPARSGRRTHISTIIRWITDGARGPNGTRVRLEGVRLGSRWLTSAAALSRFMEALTPRLADPSPVSGPRTLTQRRRESDRAAAELEKLGI